jgi:fibronectin type 3 domain-containing protein
VIEENISFRMKILLLAALFLTASPLSGRCQSSQKAPLVTSSSVNLKWDKSNDRSVKGYRVYCGLTSGRNYSRLVDVGKATTYKLTNLVPGETYYCVVKAYNSTGKESPASNEIRFTVSRAPLKK